MSIKNIGWSIGNYCNAQCKHCYSWKHRRDNSESLTKEEIDIIIDKLISYKVETVNFGGNEPIYTNNKDLKSTLLPYIIDKLVDANVLCGITTNGFTAHYLYTNHYETFLKVNDWDFSLDAPCKELHDSNRNLKGLFDSVIDGIQICTSNQIPCSIVIAGMKDNLYNKQVAAFVELARKYGTDLRINFLKPVEKHHFSQMPSIEQVYNVINLLLNSLDIITLSEPVFSSLLNIKSNGCPCGIHSFRIQSKRGGKVPITPCVYLDKGDGDLLTMEIESIVCSSSFMEITNRNLLIPDKCRELNCTQLENCRGGCSARTFLICGDNYLKEPDPYCPLLPDNQHALNNLKDMYAKTCFKSDNQIRVHENYLCTLIGSPKKTKN